MTNSQTKESNLPTNLDTLKDKLWASGIWEILNHDQLIELDKIVQSICLSVIPPNEIDFERDSLGCPIGEDAYHKAWNNELKDKIRQSLEEKLK